MSRKKVEPLDDNPFAESKKDLQDDGMDSDDSETADSPTVRFSLFDSQQKLEALNPCVFVVFLSLTYTYHLQGLTRNQNRLLYLISLYTHPAQSSEEQEGWIRKSALAVLMYEGITSKVLDYDYAPASVIVENRRIFINVSQEGKSDIDFLREEELLNGLKLQSRGNTVFAILTCFDATETLSVIRSYTHFASFFIYSLRFLFITCRILACDMLSSV